MKRPKRVLVVDDDKKNCRLLEAMLESLGHESVVAYDGLEALERVRDSIDVVLMDVMLPGIDGFEAVRRIRALPGVADIPVVMVTVLIEPGA